MAETTVATVLTRLAPLIENKIRAEVCLLLNADDEVEIISSKLKEIHRVVAQADRQGVTDDKVKRWLDKLQRIAYEIDDALDEWEVENIRQQPEESESKATPSENPWQKVCSFLESVCLCFKQTVHRRNIALDIKHINERLDSIAQENAKDFNFLPDVGGVSRDFKRDTYTEFVDVSKVYGRDWDKKRVMSKLFPESSSSSSKSKDEIQIISIVGTGGMGKTTLAQLVFAEIKNENGFKRIWVCVSDPFDEIKIAQTILNELGISYATNSQLGTLLNSIRISISTKKIFLVLDDVWIDKEFVWEPFKICLQSAAPGSRILLTTTKNETAEIMGSTYNHQLGCLSDSDCWLVLSQRALYRRNNADREMFKETGLKIVEKCNGMPLAAKTMGDLLRSKTSLPQWKNVLESKMWELEKVRKDIFPVLAVSYDELNNPSLKRCFSYCAIFPKDHLINVDDLIRIWMSQGFLSSSETMERQGREYFEDLAMRSFFQDFEIDEMNGRIIRCKMHGIVHDFAQFLTKNEILIVGDHADGAQKMASKQNALHLNLLQFKDQIHISSFPELRSLFIFSHYEVPVTLFMDNLESMRLDKEATPNVFSHLKRVRLLSLKFRNLYIPKDIGNLIHLKYLNLSGNYHLTELPESICELYNLQTLGIEYCQSLCGLPRGIDKLKKLRHLLNKGVDLKFQYPKAFEKLTNLQTLGYYCVSYFNGNKLEYLKDMNQLQGSLFIEVYDLNKLDAEKAELKSKESILELEIHFWYFNSEIMESLQPHPNLQSFSFIGGKLPNWISTLTKLTRLIVNGGHFVDNNLSSSLIPLQKLPFLEYLDLCVWKMERVAHDCFGVNNEISLAFPKLKRLHFSHCLEWKEWEDISIEEEEDHTTSNNISIMPCLEELKLSFCDKLTTLPDRLLRKVSSLKKITITKCDGLKNRYDPDRKEDWDNMPHIQFQNW